MKRMQVGSSVTRFFFFYKKVFNDDICTHISEPIALIGNKRASNGIMKGDYSLLRARSRKSHGKQWSFSKVWLRRVKICEEEKRDSTRETDKKIASWGSTRIWLSSISPGHSTRASCPAFCTIYSELTDLICCKNIWISFEFVSQIVYPRRVKYLA